MSSKKFNVPIRRLVFRTGGEANLDEVSDGGQLLDSTVLNFGELFLTYVLQLHDS